MKGPSTSQPPYSPPRCPTLLLRRSKSRSAFLAHFCQKLGSSNAMSVRFSEATKLAWGTSQELAHREVHQKRWGGAAGRSRRYLGEGGALALALDGDGGGAAQQDLVDVFLAELGAFVVLLHDGRVGPLAQEVLDLLLGELLDLPGGGGGR